MNDESDSISLDTFYDELEIMIGKSGDYESNIKIESVENGETIVEDKLSTNRLIVSTSSNQELSQNYGAIAKIEGYNNWHIFQYANYEEAYNAYVSFQELDNINYVEFDEIIDVKDTMVEVENETSETSLFWGAERVESLSVIKSITESDIILPEVVVAVIDTGVDISHEIFNNDPQNIRYIKGNRSNDNTAYQDHGTHVAGIIVSNTPTNVKIKPYNYSYYEGEELNGTTITFATEIHSAIVDEVEVINVSMGGWVWKTLSVSDAAEDEFILAAQNNIPVIVAAGNEFSSVSLVFPANSEHVITVSATDSLDCPAFFSNYGNEVDIAAPGVNIYSSVPENSEGKYYETKTGTSMAVPFVSAGAAILKSLSPKISAEEIKTKLLKSVYKPSLWNSLYGDGIVNFENMVSEYRTNVPKVKLETSGKATLTANSANTQIYYTTDGTDPIIGESELYTAPFSVRGIDKIKAIACAEGLLPSDVMTFNMSEEISQKIVYKNTTQLDTLYNSKIRSIYSTNQDVVTVDIDGNVYGVSKGNADVVMTLENGMKITYHINVYYDLWQWIVIVLLFGFIWYI